MPKKAKLNDATPEEWDEAVIGKPASHYRYVDSYDNDHGKSDGSTAKYYELPDHAQELQDLISFKDMNAQIGEIFRSCYRYGEVSHSDKMRDINKVLFYAEAEKKKLSRERNK